MRDAKIHFWIDMTQCIDSTAISDLKQLNAATHCVVGHRLRLLTEITSCWLSFFRRSTLMTGLILQADNKAHISQLQQLGLDPTPVERSSTNQPLASFAEPPAISDGWASFETSFENTTFSPPANATAHRTSTFEADFSSTPSTGLSSAQQSANDLQNHQGLGSKNQGRDAAGHSRMKSSDSAQAQHQTNSSSFAEQFLGIDDGQKDEPANTRQNLSSRGQTLPGLRVSDRQPYSTGSKSSSPSKRFALTLLMTWCKNQN